MSKAKNMLPEIIEHISPLAGSSALPVPMAEETKPLITIYINTQLLTRGIRYLKEAIPLRLLKSKT
jgi:hypothetical protein